MFQYAAAHRLARLHGTDVAPDSTYLLPESAKDPTDTPRDYALSRFGILPRRINSNESRYVRALNRLRTGWSKRNRAGVFCDWGVGYDPKFEELRDGVRLIGRFQSEKFFAKVADEIKEIYSRLRLTNADVTELKEIDFSNSIALHVRRGDLVENRRYNSSIGFLDVAYYLRAEEDLHRRIGENYKVLILSDDVGWCKKYLKLRYYDAIYISKDSVLNRDYVEFEVMRRCRHFLISNSTFSWWAAWLGGQEDKVVVSPSVWAKAWPRGVTAKSCGLIPESWIEVEASGLLC